MPFNKSSKQTYCQVPNNDFDLRIPLHSDESFQHGIVFQAKVSRKSMFVGMYIVETCLGNSSAGAGHQAFWQVELLGILW
jgi:hypothetical protein